MTSLACSHTNSDYFFLRCEWNGCYSCNDASAISLTNSDSELKVDVCSFIDCAAQAGCGGAIYLNKINKATILESSFLRCRILSSNFHENGGGSVYMHSITTQVLVTLTSFIDSSVPFDGAGVNMWNFKCTLNNYNTFRDCRFIKCTGRANNLISYQECYHEGGGIMAYGNEYNISMTNTLFSECSNQWGGGFEMSVPSSFSSPFIIFCCFYENIADLGNDVLTYPNVSQIPFLQCFTTVVSKRLGYSDGRIDFSYPSADDKWISCHHSKSFK